MKITQADPRNEAFRQADPVGIGMPMPRWPFNSAGNHGEMGYADTPQASDRRDPTAIDWPENGLPDSQPVVPKPAPVTHETTNEPTPTEASVNKEPNP